MTLKHILFVCSRNRRRSPTAEKVFSNWPGIEASSAGLSPDADEQVSSELVEGADMIFVMEKVHAQRLRKRFRRELKDARVVCLDIRDNYEYMDSALVGLLQSRVSQHLPPRQGG